MTFLIEHLLLLPETFKLFLKIDEMYSYCGLIETNTKFATYWQCKVSVYCANLLCCRNFHFTMTFCVDTFLVFTLWAWDHRDALNLCIAVTSAHNNEANRSRWNSHTCTFQVRVWKAASATQGRFHHLSSRVLSVGTWETRGCFLKCLQAH